jgi:hypothetical protein
MAFHNGYLETAYNPHSVIAYGEKFGQLVQWERTSGHNRETIGYPSALLALTAQCTVSTFLRKMAEIILDPDLGPATSGDVLWRTLVTQGFRTQDSLVGRSSYFEQPFSAPPCFDLARLSAVFQARLRAASDELEQMQSDARCVLETMRPAEKMPHAFSRLLDSSPSWPIFGSILRHFTWGMLSRQLDKILEHPDLERIQSQNSPTLPRQYGAELLRLEALLKRTFHDVVCRLIRLVQHLPAFTEYYRRDANGLLRLRISSKDAYYRDPLFWNLIELGSYDMTNQRSASFHLDQIDSILSQSAGRDSARIDQLVYDYLSEIAAVDEALSAIKYHRFRQGLPVGAIEAGHICSKMDIYQEYELLWRTQMCFDICADGIKQEIEELRALPLPSAILNMESLKRTFELQAQLKAMWKRLSYGMRWFLERTPGVAEELVQRIMSPIEASVTEDVLTQVNADFQCMYEAVLSKGKVVAKIVLSELTS